MGETALIILGGESTQNETVPARLIPPHVCDKLRMTEDEDTAFPA